MNTLHERRQRHKANVDAAFRAAQNGATINLTALMIGAEQTGADAFGGDVTIDNTSPLESDKWQDIKPERSKKIQRTKLAWIRNNSQPTGTPDKGHYHCSCGQIVNAGYYGDNRVYTCPNPNCGKQYDGKGYIIG